MQKDHSKKFITSTMWSAFGVYANRLCTLCIAVILSRLLTPKDFGTVAMIIVFSGFLANFSDAGISNAIVQFRNLKKSDYNTLFTFSLIIGITLAAIFAGLSPYIQAFFNNSELKPIVIILALDFPLVTLGIVPLGILQKKMHFNKIAMINILSAVCAGIIGIFMAYTGWGYWAIVAQTIANTFFSSCAKVLAARFLPALRWDFSIIKQIFNFSGNWTLFLTINYWARNIDNLLIGKFIGPVSLGYYNRAYQLMLLPITLLTSVITPVLHSSLARTQNDIPVMYQIYLKVIKNIGLISIPGLSYAVVMSPELIRVIWGAQWNESIPIFAILGLNAIFQPILSTTGTIFLSRNRTDLLVICGIVSTILYGSGITIGLLFGIKGVAIGYTIANYIWALPLMYIVLVKLLNGSLKDLWLMLKKPITFSTIISPIIFFLANSIRGSLPDFFCLIITFICFFLIYLCFIIRFENDVIKLFRKTLIKTA